MENHENQSIEKIIESISMIKHPAIDLSLTELGIVQDIELVDDQVIATFAFPFSKIPIADKLISSVEQQVEKMGYKLEYIVRTMKADEKEKFLLLEKQAWKGLS